MTLNPDPTPPTKSCCKGKPCADLRGIQLAKVQNTMEILRTLMEKLQDQLDDLQYGLGLVDDCEDDSSDSCQE